MTSEKRQIGQTGQTADAAMLRKDSGRQQTCLSHKEKTWGNSDPGLILPPISCWVYNMVGSRVLLSTGF